MTPPTLPVLPVGSLTLRLGAETLQGTAFGRTFLLVSARHSRRRLPDGGLREVPAAQVRVFEPGDPTGQLRLLVAREPVASGDLRLTLLDVNDGDGRMVADLLVQPAEAP